MILSKKSEKAVTLVALVISIIVLLILAGVTVGALSGDNRHITESSRIKEKNRAKQ